MAEPVEQRPGRVADDDALRPRYCMDNVVEGFCAVALVASWQLHDQRYDEVAAGPE